MGCEPLRSSLRSFLITFFLRPTHLLPPPQERALLEEGIRRFPAYAKFYLMLGQLEERGNGVEAARAVYRYVVEVWEVCTGMWLKCGRVYRYD